MQYFSLFLWSVVTTFVMIVWILKLFPALKLLDNPQKYGYKRFPIPYSTGIVFFLTFFFLSFFFLPHSEKLTLLWVFGALITTVSFIDDFFDVSPLWRLIMQIFIGAVIGITSIKIHYISNIFWWIINLETFFIEPFGFQIYIIPLLFTIFWYVLIFNAMNFSDGVTGMTSGISFISFFILFILALVLFHSDDYVEGIKNAEFIINLTLILLGSLAVFWFFDIKEKLLMWDSGTMFLGFMLASVAIIAWGKVATVAAVFGVYIVDLFYVIIARIFRGQNPMKKDFTHLHHRLLKLWFTKKQVLTFVYSISFLFGILALFLDKIGKIIIFFFIALVVILFTKFFKTIKK